MIRLDSNISDKFDEIVAYQKEILIDDYSNIYKKLF